MADFKNNGRSQDQKKSDPRRKLTEKECEKQFKTEDERLVNKLEKRFTAFVNKLGK